MKKMKSIQFLISMILVAGLTACTDSVTNLTPHSELTSANFYQTAQDMDRAVLAIYSQYSSRFTSDWQILEAPTDDMHMSPYGSVAGLEQINELDFQSSNNIFTRHWQRSYSAIFRANSVLTYLDQPENYTSNQKNQFEGEAKFLRALVYFDLVRAFGGVPAVRSRLSVEEAKNMPRSTEAEIYSHIVEDLMDAIEVLPDKGDIATGRATVGAAAALLGKVYVYMEDWDNALSYLNRVDDYNYKLEENFADLWTLENEEHDEGIFMLKFIEGIHGHSISTGYLPFFGVEDIVVSGDEWVHLSWDVHKHYEDEDLRKDATITENWRVPGSEDDTEWFPYISKYAVPHPVRSSGLDLPVIRYADVVLLRAEALFRQPQSDPQGALGELNRIRERAFGNSDHNYDLSDISTPEEFIDILLKERRLEFVAEYQRWHDLVRTGRYIDELQEVDRSYNPSIETAHTVSLNPQPHIRRFPIPLEEIDQHIPGVLQQNDGYH